jgi:hypothetical protein
MSVTFSDGRHENANFLLEDGSVGEYGDYKKMVAKKRRKERKNARALLAGAAKRHGGK